MNQRESCWPSQLAKGELWHLLPILNIGRILFMQYKSTERHGTVPLNTSCRKQSWDRRCAFISCLWSSERHLVGYCGKQDIGQDDPLAWSRMVVLLFFTQVLQPYHDQSIQLNIQILLKIAWCVAKGICGEEEVGKSNSFPLFRDMNSIVFEHIFCKPGSPWFSSMRLLDAAIVSVSPLIYNMGIIIRYL